MKKLILFLIILAGFTEGCKKYEDGPLISFRTAKNRIYGGYVLKTYTVNGEDSLNLFSDSLGRNFEFFHDDVYSTEVCNIGGIRNDGKEKYVMCTWCLQDNNKTIKFLTAHGPKGTGPFGNNILPEWQILKLKDAEIKLKTTYNNKEYIIEID